MEGLYFSQPLVEVMLMKSKILNVAVLMLSMWGCRTPSSDSGILENGSNPTPPPTPVSIVVNCTINYSDNFLGPANAKTRIKCSVTGKKAVAWRVLADGQGFSGWSGALDQNLATQEFETSYIRVGGDTVPYHVYVSDVTNGEKLRAEFNTGNGGGGDLHVSIAECEYRTGGNFFTPETHAVCNVRGVGAKKYVIDIRRGDGTTSTVWEGPLNVELDAQQINTKSQKKFLGQFSEMNLKVIDLTGQAWSFVIPFQPQ